MKIRFEGIEFVAMVMMLALGACSAGNPALPASPASSLATVDSAMRTQPEMAKVQYTIRWPSREKRVQTHRGPLWISPSTVSMVIQVNNDPKMETIANAPTGGGSTTTVTINVPVGRDTFVLVLYDRKQKQRTRPLGNVVGQAAVVQKIFAGKKNAIHATIAGVADRVTVVPAADETLVTMKRRELDFIGDQPEQLVVTAEDADGNVIVPQPTNVTLTIAPSSTSYLSIAQPEPSKNPQVFLVSPIAKLPFGGTAGLLASATTAFGMLAPASITVSESSAIYVAYANAPVGASPIVLYDGVTGEPVSLPATAFADLGSISALAYDYLDHRLLVGDNTNGLVDAFDGTGNLISSFHPISMSGIQAIAYDPNDQNIYINGLGGVSAYTKSGTPVALSPSAFQQANPFSPLAFEQSPYVQSTGIALGQSNGGGVSAYSELGVYKDASTLPVTAVLGLATDSVSAVASDIFAIGTPQSVGSANLFDVTPGNFPESLATIADPRAIAQDLNTGNLYVASSSPNEIVPVIYGTWTLGKPIPSVNGYSNPLAIAVTY